MVIKLVGTGRCLLLVNVIIDPSVVVAFLCSSVARSFTGMKVSVSRALDSVVVGLLTTVASLNLAVVRVGLILLGKNVLNLNVCSKP